MCPTGRLLPESQCGFRRHRGTIDMIFAARHLQEKCQEMRTHLCTTFVDLTKAFETVNCNGLWKIMQKFGCREPFTHMVWWYAQGRLWPRQPPAPSPASGLLDTVMAPGSGGGGGESAVDAAPVYYHFKLNHAHVTVLAPPFRGACGGHRQTTTVELSDGYMTWMSSRLSFLLIFLMGAYVFQICNAYSLYLIYMQQTCKEWHPLVVGLINGFVASGNLLTTLYVVRQKCTRLSPVKRKHLSKKYSTKYVHASDLLCDRSEDIPTRKAL
ncbi:unnamed protein product [Schistocephalus solidus]|uniref:Reverse transcriptase domain-containing protein n=1 Tax=Schistocephalus solidus TaxID=70667 RepID=A0A183SI29_SCHSO|nr:unnamed protein product [Schistocephalus solidus]